MCQQVISSRATLLGDANECGIRRWPCPSLLPALYFLILGYQLPCG